MSAAVVSPKLTSAAFQAVRELIFSVAGICMTQDKQELVRARLLSRLRALKISRYEEYLARIEVDAHELSNMVDVLTTNKTTFFREEHHFDFLVSKVFPGWRESGRPVRIWSAGCSSGEEPYSLAMSLSEHLPGHDVRILATDLSLRVLSKAKAGLYSEEAVDSIPSALRGKYVRRTQGAGVSAFEVAPELRTMISFARLNLMEAWPMQRHFDLILCRNVMIYFNDDTRTTLAHRFAQMLAPDGHFFIGHAESLATLNQPLRIVEPAIYAL